MHHEPVVESHLARHREPRLFGQGGEDVRRGGVGAALEQARQEQVALLPPEELLLLVGCLGPRKQLLRLELDQNRRHE